MEAQLPEGAAEIGLNYIEEADCLAALAAFEFGFEACPKGGAKLWAENSDVRPSNN